MRPKLLECLVYTQIMAGIITSFSGFFRLAKFFSGGFSVNAKNIQVGG